MYRIRVNLLVQVEVPSSGGGPLGGGKGGSPLNIDLGNLGGAIGGLGGQGGGGMAITLERFLGSRKEKRRMSISEARSVLVRMHGEERVCMCGCGLGCGCGWDRGWTRGCVDTGSQ